MVSKNNRILSIISQRNKKNKYIVTTSDGQSIEVSKEIIQSESLFEGRELDASDFEKIVVNENYFRVREAGLILLSYRMRSKKELYQKLNKKGFSLKVITDVVDEFEKKDWLNDYKFGLAFAKDQINRNNIGPIALKYKLKNFIDSLELIEQILNSIYSDFDIEDVIIKILQKHSVNKILIDYSLRRKLINKLKRKGHYWQDIDSAFKKYTNS
ncbi:MAG: hypothetical protein CBD77_01620 [bacterium TMED217]|nr:MAG: hypothetical protein CBD77_01620 [bacterium TMED217]